MSDILSEIRKLGTSKRREACTHLRASFGINQILSDLKKHHKSTPAIRKHLTQLSKLHVQISQDLDESHTQDIVQLISQSLVTPKKDEQNNEELKKMLVEKQPENKKRKPQMFADTNGEMTELKAKDNKKAIEGEL